MEDILKRLKDKGFEGFHTVGELMQNHNLIPRINGVYIFLRLKDTDPVFLERGTGGFFKRSHPRDPNVPINELMNNWVPGVSIVYIGKATPLKSRLGGYLNFGEGKFASHWGGRYIWQLEDSRELVVCWKTLDGAPRDLEAALISQFKKEHNGKRPFANLQD